MEALAFKVRTSDIMRSYLRFLMYHHDYTRGKILRNFPEYVEMVKMDEAIYWRLV